MWLLSTDRAELRYFSSADDVDGGYAILSHTWDGDEQSFQEVRAIAEHCKRDGTNPRDVVSAKIRGCCILAEKHGYRWAWIDSCCIDKASSSELSESINSMYRWYSQAEVCYAYLADVPTGCVLDAPDSSFRKSRWHTRGWTLQELIAPASVIFLSVDWHELGDKATLATLLADITTIDSRVLTREAKCAQFSLCTRMFWASARKTTRVEDEAYCLMGLFGVSMPTNYGEGKRAFTRLQYEIMRDNPDISLFAFGSCILPGLLSDRGITLKPDIEIGNSFQYLLASSPKHVEFPVAFTPDLGQIGKQSYPASGSQDGDVSAAAAGPFDSVELPRVTVTSYGIKLRLPVFEADGATIAVLLCQGVRGHLGLFLQRDPRGRDPTRPRYHVGCVCRTANLPNPQVARMATLGVDLNNLCFNGHPVEAKWHTFYAVPYPSGTDHGPSANLMINSKPAPPFRFPHWLLARLITLQFEVNQLPLEIGSFTGIRFFHPSDLKVLMYLTLGLCARAHPDEPPSHWARVIPSLLPEFAGHDCAEDHVDSWPGRSKDFGDADRTMRLSFMRCSRLPESTRVIHIELLGRVYEQMLRDASVSLPSLADLESSGGAVPTARQALAGQPDTASLPSLPSS